MMIKNTFYLVLIFCLPFISAFDQSGCTGTVNGKNYDFTKLTNNVADYQIPYARPTNPFTVSINICRPLVTLKVGDALCAPSTSSACQFWDTPTPKYSQSLGLSNTMTVAELTSSQGWQVTMTSAKFTAVYSIICNASLPIGTPTMPTFTQGETTWNIVWQSNVGCSSSPPTPTPPIHITTKAKVSGGAVFLILFFCGGFVYLAAGLTVNKFARHKEGVEMIPNVEFWVSFGGLIKDGGRFIALKTCKRGGYAQV